MWTADEDEVVAHLREDADFETEVLAPYINGAQAAVERYLNRSVFDSAQALAAARAQAPQAMADASAAYGAAIAAAATLTDPEAKAMAMKAAQAALDDARRSAVRDVNGIVVYGPIVTAFLLTVGHLYVNREDVLTGSRAAAVAIPMGAHDFLRADRLGNL